MDNGIEIIAKTLLRGSERVMKISNHMRITRIWDSEHSQLIVTRDGYLGKHLSNISDDPVLKQCIEQLQQCFDTEKNCVTEIKTSSNNKTISYRVTVLQCHPQRHFVLLVIENLTENSNDRWLENKWKLALDASGDGMWDADLQNNTIFFSERWHEIFGYSADEIQTLSDWTEKIFPDDIAVSDKSRNSYISGEASSYHAEVRYKCKDGSYKWILSRGVMISGKEDGAPVRFIGTHTDINERKLVEEELRTSKETFANSFNFSGTGKALIAPGGRWIEVNNVICELTGYSREELLDLHYRDITYPDDVDKDAELILQLVNNEIQSYSIEKRYLSKTRKIIEVLLTVTLVRSASRAPKYFVCDIMDITEIKQLNDELARKNAELEITSDSLTEKINTLEEFNNIVAHNFRGPIGNIKMLVEEPELFGSKDIAKLISESSALLLNELDTLLELSKIRLNHAIAHDDCSFSETINNILAQLMGSLYQKHIKVTVSLEAERISYPRIYLENILYNLISNAIKYSRSDIDPVIKIATKVVGSKITLSIQDNGIGIDMELYHDRVFKLNQIFHEGYDSKGVGLFIVKNQIEAVGGTISVSSKLNEGTEFIVTF